MDQEFGLCPSRALSLLQGPTGRDHPDTMVLWVRAVLLSSNWLWLPGYQALWEVCLRHVWVAWQQGSDDNNLLK